MLGQMNPVALKLFGLEIHWYAIFIVGGALLGTYIANREAIKHGFDREVVTDFILIALPLAIVGARLYYVLFQIGYYLKHPAEVIAIWNGGLAIYGGLITGMIVFYYFSKERGLSQWKFLDILLPSVLLGQAIGRWGNFVNQEAYGSVVSKGFLTDSLHLPNFIVENMYIDGAYHQPTFLYESIWCFIGFFLFIFLRRKTNFFKVGQIATLELMWYSFARFFIEGLRLDSLMIGPFRVSQMLSALVFLVSLSLFIWRTRLIPTKWYFPGQSSKNIE